MKRIIDKIVLIMIKSKNFLLFGNFGILTIYTIKINDKFIVDYTFIKGEDPEKELKNYLNEKYQKYKLLDFNLEF